MSDKHKDVLIAVYLFEDLAKKDFDAVLKLAEEKTITVEGVVLVQKDDKGEVSVKETGDHLGRKGCGVRKFGSASDSSAATTAAEAVHSTGRRLARAEWSARSPGLSALVGR
jgi:hypothetical protein